MSASSSYGSCLGPASEYIVLISSDGQEFIMKTEVALMSETLQLMHTGPGGCSEDERSVIHLRDISSRVLRNICRYLAYKKKYDNDPSAIPIFHIDEQVSLDTLVAADFLRC